MKVSSINVGHVDTWSGRKGRVGWTGRVALTIYTPPRVKQIAAESCCIVQGAQLGALWWPRGLGGREAQEGGVYVYLWLIHDVEQQKPTHVKQFSSNWKKREKHRLSADTCYHSKQKTKSVLEMRKLFCTQLI